MIPTIIFYIVGLFISMIAFVFPDWQLWPEIVFEGFEYFIDTLMSLNVVLLVVPDILEATQFLIRFLVYFFIFLLLRKVFNYFRGVGQGI